MPPELEAFRQPEQMQLAQANIPVPDELAVNRDFVGRQNVQWLYV